MNFLKKYFFDYIKFISVLILLIPLSISAYILTHYFIIWRVGNQTPVETVQTLNILLASAGAFGTMILALATFASLLHANKKDKENKEELLNKYKKDHSDNIKENCLLPIFRDITDRYYNSFYFEINERQNLFDEQGLKSDFFNNPFSSYDEEAVFSKYNEITGNGLCKDLEKCKITKDIFVDYRNILILIHKKAPIFLADLVDFILKIKSLPQYKELTARLLNEFTKRNLNVNVNVFTNSIEEPFFNFILASALSLEDDRYLKQKFPNRFRTIYYNNGLEAVKEIINVLKNHDYTKKLIDIKYEVKEKVDGLRDKINSLLDNNVLLG